MEEAAKRELFEETGLVANSLELFGVFSGIEMRYVYPNGDEVSELKFFSITELPKNISPPQRKPLNDFVKLKLSETAKESI